MKPIMPRDDIRPVILGGDWSTYSIAREFYEAFGVTSYCVAPGAVSVIGKSRFVEMLPVDTMGQSDVLEAIRVAVGRNEGKRIVLMANTDDRVATVEAIRDDLPESVVFQFPPREAAALVSDKVSFAELCSRHGLDTPRTEVVSLGGEGRIQPSEVGFPLIAKPAVSAEYASYFEKGFQKVYFFHRQEELDGLWRDLREAGFGGTFLVQELIPGDDTYMDSITMYVDSLGRVTLRASAQVLLEDHVPLLFGNPVAMITKPMPELWEKLEGLLGEIGWHGFVNVDLKRDPRDGRQVFMDCNPRIGSNSYYVCAGGVNPMYMLVRDIVDGVAEEPRHVERNVLYERVPTKLARRYLRDPELRSWFDAVVRAGGAHNPTRCPDDTKKARLYGLAMERNYIRKFKRYYPEPTDTSF